MEILKRDAEQAEVCRTVYGYFDSNQIAVDESKQALAKVSELVEAAKLVNGDHCAPYDCYATGPRTGDPILDLVRCPGCQLAAALQAFGGEG